jgi:hypothetical protein
MTPEQTAYAYRFALATHLRRVIEPSEAKGHWRGWTSATSYVFAKGKRRAAERLLEDLELPRALRAKVINEAFREGM